MKPMTKNNGPKTWNVSNWINIAIAVLSALVGAIGAQAATVSHMLG